MPRESQAARRQRVKKITAILRKVYPNPTTALHHSNALELLVATILSAQCTDARVNKVTPALFERFKTAADYASADPKEFQQLIVTTGFFRNKTRSIIGMAKKLVADHAGKVPDNMDALLALPGVARKTANVVLGSWFGRNEGIVVDTHVTRVSGRLGLTAHASNAGDKIEKDLMELVPQQDWTDFAHLLILHGRATCTARKPDCAACPINKLCPSAFKV